MGFAFGFQSNMFHSITLIFLLMLKLSQTEPVGAPLSKILSIPSISWTGGSPFSRGPQAAFSAEMG